MAKHWKQPDTKKCGKCHAMFEKNGNISEKHWDQTKNCPICREKKGRKRDRNDHIGIAVFHPLLDQYLYGSL